MTRSNDLAIDRRIVEMNKKRNGLVTIQKWLIQWDNFSQLDEQVVLAHILNVLAENEIKVTKNQIKYVFDKNYSKNAHGDKQSYLTFLYGIMGRVPSLKDAHSAISEPKDTPHCTNSLQTINYTLKCKND